MSLMLVRVMSKIQRFTALRREKRVRQELSSFQCWTSLTFQTLLWKSMSDTEEADEMNIIDNDSDVDSDIDVED